MPDRKLSAGIVLIWMGALVLGCQGSEKSVSAKAKFRREKKTEIVVPPYIKGTVSEFAGPIGGGNMAVQAHGIVVGLGTTGSSEVPSHLRQYLIDYLTKEKLGSPISGTGSISPNVVLQDKDTAVVLVGGAIPSGAPKGTRFDLYVTALPQTRTESLEGGVLMPLGLQFAFGGMSLPGQNTETWAQGRGQVFVNPFIDSMDPSQKSKLREGRIIGGGEVSRSRPIRLQLFRPDYAMAERIQRSINDRFSSTIYVHSKDGKQFKAANSISRAMIDLNVPAEYEKDYEHYLKLVLHLPVHYGQGGPEAFALKIAEEMKLPQANCEELALILEAMGQDIVEEIQKLYTFRNSATSFYAARAGMRLGDSLATEPILRFAKTTDSPFQIPAIEELGRQPRLINAIPLLRELLDSRNESVRLAAYEALRRRGDRSITQIPVGSNFTLDLVSTNGEYAVYATQTQSQRIALFGREMALHLPIFFETPGELITINALPGEDKIKVFRKIFRTRSVSDPAVIDPSVAKLVELLGSKPEVTSDGQVKGLGLTYSQVVGVLYRLCLEKNIPAKFVLQQRSDVQRIFKDAATVGRPDMPGD